MREGTTQAIANTLWAFATNGHHSDKLFNAAAEQSNKIIRKETLKKLQILSGQALFLRDMTLQGYYGLQRWTLLETGILKG